MILLLCSIDKDILPYLPTLMEHMLMTLKTSTSTRPKELAISAIGATGMCLCCSSEWVFQQQHVCATDPLGFSR